MLVHLNYSLKWEIFIKLFHIFKLRHSLNDSFPNKIDTFPLVTRHDKIYANFKV